MKYITQQQMDNLIEARDEMWPSVPPENVAVKLHMYIQSIKDGYPGYPTCNTIACFGGWCALYPEFIKQGVHLNQHLVPRLDADETKSVSEFLFGSFLFHKRGENHYDLTQDWNLTDHEIVQRRLNEAVKNSRVKT